MDTNTMNTTTNHGAVIPLLPTRSKPHVGDCNDRCIFLEWPDGYDKATIHRVMPDEVDDAGHKASCLTDDEWQEVCDGVFPSLFAPITPLEDQLAAAKVRVASYEYWMLRLAEHYPLHEDRALWPIIMHSRYADLKAEFEDYKDAVSSYFGDARVYEALTHYEINNRHTN